MFTPQGPSIAPPPSYPFGSACSPLGRNMLTIPVGFGYRRAAPARILNCSIMEMPAGILGTGKSGEALLAAQRLPFSSRASARTLKPAWFDLGGVIGGEPQQGVRLRVANPHTVL